MKTQKLFETEQSLFTFSARVLACEKAERGWAVCLDRTAFFPEGGGQAGDRGLLGPATVEDTRIVGGEIWHYVNRELQVGEQIEGRVDEKLRFSRMQNHSGEHIVSGTAHRLFGLDNVGFHLGDEDMTIDLSGELDAAMLSTLEREANRAVWLNLPIRAWFPTAEELGTLSYRSKKEVEGPLRLVEIEGVDLCACCAPHVSFTGQIGLIWILSAERHRGGTRLRVVCGERAFERCLALRQNAVRVSHALSLPPERIGEGVERLQAERDALKLRAAEKETELLRLRAEAMGESEGNLVVFFDELSEVALRDYLNQLAEKCRGLAAGFVGSDETGYRYTLISRRAELGALRQRINAALKGRGGGRGEMLQGFTRASREELERAVSDLAI